MKRRRTTVDDASRSTARSSQETGIRFERSTAVAKQRIKEREEARKASKAQPVGDEPF